MTRFPDWQVRFETFVASRADTPFVWGASDCVLFALDTVLVLTGADGPPHARAHRCAKSAARAIKKAAQKAGLAPAGLDLYEMNEAFASVALVSMDQLGIDDSKVNVNGGAIALGHPIGMSGARIVLHLANELKRRGGGTGAAALCGGGGQGDALIIRVP